MQIHELTQPKKTKLDEVDWVGPDSVFAQAKSAWKTGGKSLIDPIADQDAQQARYQDYAANAIAKGKEQGLDQKPTLDSALAKLKANPVAKQWIDGIVAKWPEEAKTLASKRTPGNTPTSTGGVATTTAPGVRHYVANPNLQPTIQPTVQPTVQPAIPTTQGQSLDLDQLKKNTAIKQVAGQAGQKQAQQQMAATQQANAAKNAEDAQIKTAADAAKAKPAFQQTASDKLAIKSAARKGIKEDGAQAFSNMAGQLSPVSPDVAKANLNLSNGIKAWINSQLGTIDLKTVEAGVPELKLRIEKLINQVVSLNGDIPAQQKALHDIFALATAANHVIDWDRRTSGGNNLRYQARRGQQGQPTQVGLTSTQLRDLAAQADQAGGPDPKTTGNKFWDDLIKQAMGSR